MDYDLIAEHIAKLVENAVEKMPRAKDGADGVSITAKDVEPLLRDLVTEAIKAIPPAPAGKDGADGKDGERGDPGDKGDAGNNGADGRDGKDGERGADGKDGADGRDGADGKDGEKGEAGAPGKDGADGKDVDIEQVKALLKKMVDDAVAAIPPAAPGKDGERGDKGDSGEKGADGVNGKDGADGKSPTAEAVAAAMEGIFSKWVLDYERRAADMIQRAVDRIPEPKDGAPGRDALPIESFDMKLAEDGRTLEVAFANGLSTVKKSIKLNTIIDRGVYRPEQKYEAGDAISYGGNLWIAQKDAPDGKPGSTKDWRLAVKRGRDGSSKVKLEHKPQPVKLGSNNE